MLHPPGASAPHTESSTIRRRGRLGLLTIATTTALLAGAFVSAPAHAAEMAIADVQGTADVSPVVGQTVTVQGVVTGDYRTGGYRGITIQTQGSGGDTDATAGSDGIFVFLGNLAPTLERGALIEVTGAVSEYFGQTQIAPAALTDVVMLNPTAGLPAPTPLVNSVSGADHERYESMYVVPDGDWVLTSSHQLYNFGTLWLAPNDLNVKSTEVRRPGPEADAIAAQNRAERLLLDDGWSSQVTSNAHTGEQPYFTADTVVRNGDRVNFAPSGYILQYGFDDWRLQPPVPIDNTSDASYKATFTTQNPRTDTPPSVGGDARVASFNVFNYFTTLRSENPDARGAATPELFAAQKAKIVTAISALDADVVALMEIENSIQYGKPIDSAVADLVAGLNAAAGSTAWAYVPTPQALNDPAITDAITNAIIYRTDAATPVGDSMTIVDESVWDIAREPIAQTFQIGGELISVVANHFKSKSPPEEGGDEPADGQGFFNAERVEQAQSLLRFTDTITATSGSSDIVLLGDFNAYSQEDPINTFTQAGWSNLVRATGPNDYTYTFDGELGSLDHAIASPSLIEKVTGAKTWMINSPEWGDRGYSFGASDGSSMYRSSDHDPVIVGLDTAADPVNIDIVTINDFHGRIEANGASAGAAVLAGAVQQVRDANPNTIFAAAGDLIGASTFTSFIQDDNPTIDALNAAGLDVSAAGNHEFDQGWADLRDRVQDRANWEYISSNVFLTETGQPALAPSWVTEMDGVRVGFIGAVTEELDSLVSPAGIAGLEVRSIVDSVNDVATQLTDGDTANGEADVIILLVHEGAATAELNSIVPGTPMGDIVAGVNPTVNAIVSAHTHLAYNHVIDGRPVVSAGQYGENFGLMRVVVDPVTKDLISINNQIMPLVGDDDEPLYPAIPAVQQIVDDATAEAEVLGNQKVGDITADFNRARQGDGSENRGGESTIGNFVADVQQWATDADIAFMNPGGIRANLTYASSGEGDPDGNVTYREAATVQPFANTLVTMELTGAQIKQVLEEQWQPADASRPFLKLGVSKGFTYTYDPAKAAGERIEQMMLNGQAIDPAKTYVVAANSFLASGGDNFATFAEGANKADTGKIDLSSMVEWFSENKTATPDLGQRSVGISIAQPQAGESAVAVTLSSLAFTGGEAIPTEVTATIGGEVVGTGTIDPTIVDAGDETGRAVVTVELPASMSGPQTVTFTAGDTTFDALVAFPGGPENPGKGSISLSARTIAAGGHLDVHGEGFPPGQKLILELRSTPVQIGTVTVDPDGTFTVNVTIPAATPAGAHQIVAIAPDGTEVAVALTVTAQAGGGLANTGAETPTGMMLAALMLLLVGAGLMRLRRRETA